MATAVDLNGVRTQGRDVRMANITAAQALANIVKTSFGPHGLDKMLMDEIGDVTVTNDGATILRQLEVEHPAARVLVELSQQQDAEVGDGTTSVVLLAAELLKRAHELLKNRVHAASIIAGYKHAARLAVQYITGTLAIDVSTLGDEGLANVARTALGSKLIAGEAALFGALAVKAVKAVRNSAGRYPIKNIHVTKAHGKSMLDSVVFSGHVLRMSRVSQQMPVRVEDARIACLDFALSRFRLAMGVQVLVNDPRNLEELRRRELDILKERLELILAAGTTVIFTTKAMDDAASKYLVERGVMGLRRVDRGQLSRIARATGATLLTTLAGADGAESFDAASLGRARAVFEQNLGDNEYVFVELPAESASPIATLVLRGANETLLDEVDRSMHDLFCVLKRTLESGRVVTGGGAVEAALSVHLEADAQKSATREQAAVSEFAEALLVLPKQLALNAAKDATELVAKLLVVHSTFQSQGGARKYESFQHCGLDLDEGKIRNNLEAGVLEPEVSKVKMIKMATEAAIAILRIDDMIKLAAEKEDMPHRH